MLNIFYDALKYIIICYIQCNHNDKNGNNSCLLSQQFLNTCESEPLEDLLQTLGYSLDQLNHLHRAMTPQQLLEPPI